MLLFSLPYIANGVVVIVAAPSSLHLPLPVSMLLGAAAAMQCYCAQEALAKFAGELSSSSPLAAVSGGCSATRAPAPGSLLCNALLAAAPMRLLAAQQRPKYALARSRAHDPPLAARCSLLTVNANGAGGGCTQHARSLAANANRTNGTVLAGPARRGRLWAPLCALRLTLWAT